VVAVRVQDQQLILVMALVEQLVREMLVAEDYQPHPNPPVAVVGLELLDFLVVLGLTGRAVKVVLVLLLLFLEP
jgi:hypothetical protein